ncbi:hypothetical protein JD507_14620 [Aeromonas jandaei]|uniref:DUF3226 domain-containing protein n=1 Tax=Aeromonas jandaei TaxID=650 RepID=UPI00191E88F1|nr:DUF3226 domain-containing protein [Aeromonas jandaei]MBL0546437.1 hypothetical protein [Aeromonas jandaei]
MNITFVYCEGPHDVAFISKILRSLDGFSNIRKKVSELPKEIAGIVSSAIKSIDLDKIRVDKPLDVFMPNQIFQRNEDHYYLLYSMGGKNKLQATINNIDTSQYLLGSKIEQVAHLIIVDADYEHLENGGLHATVTYINEQFREFLPSPLEGKASTVKTDKFGYISLYVITDPEGQQGTLEDILEGIIKPVSLVEPADNYCDQVIGSEIIDKISRDPTKRQKAKLTVISQAFHPGSSLAVGIYNEELINTGAINELACVDELKAVLSTI